MSMPRPSILVALALLSLLPLTACGGGYTGSTTPPPTPTSTTTLQQAATPHGITVGTAADAANLGDTSYTAILGSEFGQLEPENEMKFGVIHPNAGNTASSYDFSGADSLVAFAQAHSMMVRGHTMVWHNQLPAWLTTGVTSNTFAPSDLSTILQQHITTVMDHYAGKVYAWDVVNEAFNEDGTLRSTVWYDSPGIGFAGQQTRYIQQVMQWAHTADPNAKLFYNDFNAETMNAKSDAIYLMAQSFKQSGTPLDGIGFQMHLTLAFDDPGTLASLTANLQRFAALGLTLHITEMDIRLPDSSSASLTAQAHLYGEIASICRQQPACKVLQTWGFTDKYSWIPAAFPGFGSALLWDANYQKKPSYTAVHDTLSQ